MKLYYSPGACSMVIRMLLLHVGAPFDPIEINLADGEQRQAAYRAVNPKGKIPAVVRSDGTVLTELGTIAAWIASTHPEYGLLPDDLDERLRVQEMMEYCVGTLHVQGVMRIFTPWVFGGEDAADAIRAQGVTVLKQGLDIVDVRLGSHDYIATSLSIADFMLFWIALGAAFSGIDLPAGVDRHYQQMGKLAAVRESLSAEGMG